MSCFDNEKYPSFFLKRNEKKEGDFADRYMKNIVEMRDSVPEAFKDAKKKLIELRATLTGENTVEMVAAARKIMPYPSKHDVLITSLWNSNENNLLSYWNALRRTATDLGKAGFTKDAHIVHRVAGAVIELSDSNREYLRTVSGS